MRYPQNPRERTAEKISIGIIVLAAGGSSRMKRPKQLLGFQGKTLLRRAAETAVASIADFVLVVLGANFERTRAEIEDLPVEIVFNEDWKSGLGSSIRTGIENLLAAKRDENQQNAGPTVSACLMMLADQPFVTTKHLNLLAQKYLDPGEKLIVAAKYNQTTGVPAIFSAAVFDDLRKLAGDEGAKKVIEKYGPLVETINLPEAAFDIDTPRDLEEAENRFDSGFRISDFGFDRPDE